MVKRQLKIYFSAVFFMNGVSGHALTEDSGMHKEGQGLGNAPGGARSLRVGVSVS